MLSELTPECEGREMLVPLTESLYVPGRVKVRDVLKGWFMIPV